MRKIVKVDGLYQRPGYDHDPIKPGMWGTYRLREPIEIMSYPCPATSDGVIDDRATIMIRMDVGDPTTLVEVLLREVACFDPTRYNVDVSVAGER